jgi:hypothetical protein
MNWNWTHGRSGRYFAPDEKGGGGAATEEKTEEEEAKVEEEVKTEETKTEETSEEEEPKEEAKEEVKPRDLTDEEIAEKAIALGFVKPEEKKEEKAETKVQSSLVDVPDFREKAAEEVAADPSAKDKGWIDEDGDLTDVGLRVAENHALRLAARHEAQQTQAVEAVRALKANAPEIEERNLTTIKTTLTALPEDVAKNVAKQMTQVTINMGLDAFDTGENETDPVIKEAKKKQATHLHNHAYYSALGVEYEKILLAQAEGGDAGDKAKESVSTGSGGDGIYAGLPKADVEWLKGDWAKTSNGGKPPTKEQVEELKKRGAIG